MMNEDFFEKKRDLGELLFRYMHKGNLSELELAHKIGVHFETLENWLNGTDIPKFKYVFKIIRIFALDDTAQKELFRLTDNWEEISAKNPTFKKMLNHYMEEKNITDGELAHQIVGHRVTVDRWRNGTTKKPGCDRVMEIAKALNLTDKERDELRLAAGYWPLEQGEIYYSEKESFPKPAKLEAVPIPGIPISHPSQLFGQTEVLKRIYRAWQQPTILQHVALIGAKRSGKTSLLKYLQHIIYTPLAELRLEQPQGWNNWQPVNFKFVFIDFQRIAMSNPESLFRNILKQLNVAIPESCDLIYLSKLLEANLKKPTIILMDEIGAGLKAPALDRSFWANLRALGSIGQLGFVITAHEAVHTLVQDDDKESSFFNIFGHTIPIEPLPEWDACALINSFARPFPTAEIDWLLEKSGRWPALLQILSDERIYALDNNDRTNNWKINGLERIKPFLYLFKSSSQSCCQP